jgi:hypothetical protein
MKVFFVLLTFATVAAAQAVFEGACKRAGIEISACQYDAKAQAVVKAEVKK